MWIPKHIMRTVCMTFALPPQKAISILRCVQSLQHIRMNAANREALFIGDNRFQNAVRRISFLISKFLILILRSLPFSHIINDSKGVKCPAGQIYEECSTECFRSCSDIETLLTSCQTKCIEGCRCPKGQALDDHNECIPIKMCPCIYKGLTFNAGYKEVRPGTKHLDLW